MNMNLLHLFKIELKYKENVFKYNNKVLNVTI